MSKTVMQHTYMFLTRNKDGRYTKWAETNVLEVLERMVDYFMGCNHPEDFIVYEKGTNRAMRLPELKKHMEEEDENENSHL